MINGKNRKKSWKRWIIISILVLLVVILSVILLVVDLSYCGLQSPLYRVTVTLNSLPIFSNSGLNDALEYPTTFNVSDVVEALPYHNGTKTPNLYG